MANSLLKSQIKQLVRNTISVGDDVDFNLDYRASV